MLDDLVIVFRAGGWVMYPLLVLSLVSVALSFERAAFWITTHTARRRRRVGKLTGLIRAGDTSGALRLAARDRSVYGAFTASLLDRRDEPRDAPVTEATAHEILEDFRPTIERFGVVLSTIITAAPLLGILGTVIGIIHSFRLLGGTETVDDPATVMVGIAQALYTTAFGLIIALVTLFPFVVFRGQSERCFARLEALAAAAIEVSARRSGSPGERA